MLPSQPRERRRRRVIDDDVAATTAAVEQVYRELNFPSAAKLKRVLQARGIPFDPKEIQKLSRDDPVRAVQASGYRFNGKIASAGLDDRWFADLIDFTAAPSDGGRRIASLAGTSTQTGQQYILVAQDVFSRKIWAEALLSKKPEGVAEGMRRILKRAKGRKPKSILTDSGAEFTGSSFEKFAQSQGITLQHKETMDTNAIATLDVAIGNLKKALARVTRASGDDDWSVVLQKVVEGQNALPNDEYLEGQAPNSVEGNADLREHLKERNREFTAINTKNAAARRQALEQAGGFRVPVTSATAAAGPQGRRRRRAWKPKFESSVHQVQEVAGGKVIAANDGAAYDTRFVNPAYSAAGAVAARASKPSLIERGGSVPVQNKQREALRVYADELAQTMRAATAAPVTTTTTVRSIPSKLADKNAFREMAANVRLNKKSLYKNFLNLFPELFVVSDGKVSLVPPKRRLIPAATPASAPPADPAAIRRRVRRLVPAALPQQWAQRPAAPAAAAPPPWRRRIRRLLLD